MKKSKAFLLSITTLFYFCHVHACMDQTAGLMIVLFRGQICSVVLSTDTVQGSVSEEVAATLVGSGSNEYWIGTLTFFIYNNEPTNPHTVELISTTYDAGNQRYYASNGTDEIVIGVKRNFDNDGNTISYETLSPITNPIIVRQGSGMILEDHYFRFYINEASTNVFSDGSYVANFRLYFTSP